MTERDPSTNPYAPTSTIDGDAGRLLDPGEPRIDKQPATLTWTAVRWFFICSVSAIPSFLLGMAVTNGTQIAAMIIGILIFATGYTLADYRTAQLAWRKKPMIRRTMRIAYGTRIAISIIVPLGAQLDMLCGIAALSLTEGITGQGFSIANQASGTMLFRAVILTTLIQGCLMNLVLAVYAALVLGIQIIVHAIRH